MREKYMLALANLINGAELGYKDISSIPQYKKDIEYYVDELLKENKKLNSKINNAIEKLYLFGEMLNPTFQQEMLKILGD